MQKKIIFIVLVAVFTTCIILLTLPQQHSLKKIPTSYEAQALERQIQAYAASFNEPPIDAKVDRVWKAIPGYNGISINIEKSMQQMNDTFDESKLVIEEVSPKIQLKDLPPSPIYRGNPQKPMVSLLINVAWGNEFIPPILATLEQHGVSATFFFDGSWVQKNPELAQQIADQHHEIGSHAYSHPDLKTYGEEATRTELVKTNDVITQTIGQTPTWFAPPSGSFSDITIQVAHELQMNTILWTVDTVDWKKPDPTEMVNRVLKGVDNGVMILMHPTEPVAQGLDRMISEIKERGLAIGTVSELMSEERVIE